MSFSAKMNPKNTIRRFFRPPHFTGDRPEVLSLAGLTQLSDAVAVICPSNAHEVRLKGLGLIFSKSSR